MCFTNIVLKYNYEYVKEIICLLFRATEEYSCKSGECIDLSSICDGISDCNDKSDETLELCKSKVVVYVLNRIRIHFCNLHKPTYICIS